MEQKINWGLLLLIGILSSLIISSCREGEDEGGGGSSTFAYTNSSDHSLSLEKWIDGESVTFDLAKGEIISFRFEFRPPGGNCYINDEVAQNPNTCLLIAADSLIITFDDDKFLLLKREDIGVRNILNEENYQYSKNGNSELFEYEFTEEDYEAAQ